MKIKTKLNWMILGLFFIGINVITMFPLRFETYFGKMSLIDLSGLILFVWTLLIYFKTISAKKRSVLTYKVKSPKILPILSFLFFGFLFLFQLMVFIVQKDDSYHYYYFINNSLMFSSFILLSLYYLFSNALYVSKGILFFRDPFSVRDYDMTIKEDRIEFISKRKLSYYSSLVVFDSKDVLERLKETI